MLTKKHGSDAERSFADSADVFGALDADAAQRLAIVAGDIALVIDDTGDILDSAIDLREFPEFEDWTGTNWLETVTIESRPKLMEMLAAARKGESHRWRQVNHPTTDGDVPVRYSLVGLGNGRHLAFGRDLRDVARTQQRLLQVQQALERDYMRMRQLEARYRMLFERSREAVLIVEADSHRIREANPAAERLAGARADSLPGKKLGGLFDSSSRDSLTTQLGAALGSDSATPLQARLSRSNREVTVAATGFSQNRRQYLLLIVTPVDEHPVRDDHHLSEIVETMPDAFVLADADMRILRANAAFVELVEAASEEQLSGRSLSRLLGRPGIDLDLIAGQMEKDGVARNVTSVVRSIGGTSEEPVEISAVATQEDPRYFGFVIRPVARRLREVATGGEDLPRSVDELTDLVGRMPLKDIVRESTDLIERLCIEAALLYTSDNRASAAEILGLSRQSLYSKLNRYGLGKQGEDAR
ncbi:transcriptional regulator PpsR [Alteriqipengyuania lutimaris]|uniref:Transcriptional regulator PpsR n=1 Tax=Alteriqipengyuania lutimaris TaxID=1538146 RepID=A0A395LJQ2_9SPHN|nr:transcriptional regulator PpsR [Alteriqipengyuania lutimaris]MBB3033786.1 transcriptional regulator PpsR [Alteriqipengyuania lutimaris]RDS77236.1 transcriptional regulator PpsR [Alteriqipengyuania lutimaris]